MVEPENTDVAFRFSGQATGAGEVREHRGAGVAAVALLDGKPAREQRVAARCIHQEFRFEAPELAVAVLACCDDAPFLREVHLRDSAALDQPRAFGGGVVPKDLVKLGTPHLVGIEQVLVPCLGKVQLCAPVVPGGDELDAILGHAGATDRVLHAEFLEQGKVQRQQRLADMETGMGILLDDDDVLAPLGEQCPDGRARRTAADNKHVGLAGAHHADATSILCRQTRAVYRTRLARCKQQRGAWLQRSDVRPEARWDPAGRRCCSSAG